MDDRIFTLLEYDKIIQRLSHFAVSDSGKRLLLGFRPFATRAEVHRALSEVEEALFVWQSYGGNPMGNFHDLSQIVFLCRGGGIPSKKELLLVKGTLASARMTAGKIGEYGEEGSVLRLAQSLSILPQIEDEIGRCILSEDEMADGASPDLYAIRRRIRGAREKIQRQLARMVPQYQEYLSDAIVTQRNSRYVLPVRIEHMNRVQGFIHDRSNSGVTVFIEPVAVLEANNELKELQLTEQAEMERILQILGASVARHENEILTNHQVLSRLDSIFARAGFSRSIEGVRPSLEGEMVNIVGARHPLIPKETVVPLTIRFGDEESILVVTGPNTGGKTVVLKTVGLFSLMAQSGLYLPAKSAVLPLFVAIHGDIGDEQSIEQSLSTFSSHMGNIVSILEKAENGHLVLLDELGAGTDPTEGAALAIAILEILQEAGAYVISTTHYSEVKSFAMTKRGFLNAGMEFDMETLTPTYRLLLHHIGASNAFAISKRLGLSEEVLTKAEGHLSQEAMAFENALRRAETLSAEVERIRDDAVQEARHIRKEAQKEIEQERQKIAEEQERTKDALAATLKELEEAKKIAQEAIEAASAVARAERNRDREQALFQARTAVREMEQSKAVIAEQRREEPLDLSALRLGERVYLVSAGAEATVLSLPDARGELQLQAGIMKMTVNIKDVQMSRQSGESVERKGRRNRSSRPVVKAVSMEYDVRGQTVEEAIIGIDLYLDAAVMGGLHEVSIIHGKGTGALRDGLREYFRRHPVVLSLRPGGYGEGEDGVTILSLR